MTAKTAREASGARGRSQGVACGWRTVRARVSHYGGALAAFQRSLTVSADVDEARWAAWGAWGDARAARDRARRVIKTQL